MDTNSKADELLKNTDLEKAIESGNTDEAIRILTEIVQRDKSHEPAFFYLSQCFLEKKEYFPALRCLKNCLYLKTRNAAVFQNLGDLYNKLCIFDLAEHYLRVLIESNKVVEYDLTVLYWDVLMNMGRYDDIIAYLKKKLNENHDSEFLQHLLATTYLVTDINKIPQLDKALAILDKLTKAKSPLAENLRELIESHNPEKDAIEMQKSEKEARKHLVLAIQKLEQRDLQDAMKELWEALELYPYHAVVYTNLGCIFDEYGFFEEGKALHEYAIRLDPELAFAYNNLGYVLNVMGKTEEAIKVYNRALELDPNIVEALNSLGTIHDNLGNFDKGVSFFKKSLEINPDKPSTLNNMAFALRASGNDDEARQYLERAINVAPKSIVPRLNLSGIYVDNCCPNEAETQLLEVLKIEPDSLDAWIKIARCYELKCDSKRFAEAIKKILTIPPSDKDDVFDAAKFFDRLDNKRALKLWKMYIEEASSAQIYEARVNYAKKRVEQIEETIHRELHIKFSPQISKS